MSDARNTLRLWNPIQEHERIKTTFDVLHISSAGSSEETYCLIPHLVLQLYKSFSSKQTSETALVTDFVPFFSAEVARSRIKQFFGTSAE